MSAPPKKKRSIERTQKQPPHNKQGGQNSQHHSGNPNPYSNPTDRLRYFGANPPGIRLAAGRSERRGKKNCRALSTRCASRSTLRAAHVSTENHARRQMRAALLSDKKKKRAELKTEVNGARKIEVVHAQPALFGLVCGDVRPTPKFKYPA